MPANQPQQGALNLSDCNEVRHIRNWLVQECPALAETITFDLLDNALEQAMVAARRQVGLPDYPKPPLGAHLAPAEPTVTESPFAFLEGDIRGASELEASTPPKPTHSGAELPTPEAFERAMVWLEGEAKTPQHHASVVLEHILSLSGIINKNFPLIPQGPAPTGEGVGMLHMNLTWLRDVAEKAGRGCLPKNVDARAVKKLCDDTRQALSVHLQLPADKPGQMSQVEKSGLKALARLYQITNNEEQLNLLDSLENHIIGQDHLIAALEASHSPLVEALQTIVANTEADAIKHFDYEHLARDICDCATAALAAHKAGGK